MHVLWPHRSTSRLSSSSKTSRHVKRRCHFKQELINAGVCLKHLPEYDENKPDQFEYHSQNIPWQRVVNAKGGISPRGDGGAAANRQAQRLRSEGVEVEDGRGADEASVDFSRFGWFPKDLPDEPGDEA